MARDALTARGLMQILSTGLMTTAECRRMMLYSSTTPPNAAITIPGGTTPWQQPAWSANPASPVYARGIAGFDGRGALPAPQDDGQVPDVYGTVRGYRWWTLPAPPLHLSPAHAEENWPRPTLLRGQMGTWQPGGNIAACKTSYPHDPSLVPAENCGCGFWAYWRLQLHELGGSQIKVCGVIEGYGAVLIGEKGFRAAKARIVALHLPLTIQPEAEPDDDPLGLGLPRRQRPYYRTDPWGFLAAQGSRVSFHGMPDPRNRAPVPPPEPTAEEREAAEQIRQADRDRAEAWMAVIGDRLEREYPGARVFETREAMERCYPPDTTYEPQALCRCSESSMFEYIGMNGHTYDCPQYR